MRNISFSLTTPQFKARTKDVTRRLGWGDVRVGERLMGCEKCMGRKAGEPLVRLGPVEVASVRQERLGLMVSDEDYGAAEVAREGFPGMPPNEFAAFFCASHKKCTIWTNVTRIEFRYVESWHFVIGEGGTLLASFPELELAESYAAGTRWSVVPQEILFPHFPRFCP